MNRRTVAGVCLIAAPLVHLASCFFWPAGSEGSAAQQVATAAAHPGAIAAAALADAASWVLLLPALVVLWQEVRTGRGATLVSIGVWGTVLGVLGYVGGTVLTLVTVDLGRSAGGAAVYEALKHDGTITAVVVLPILLGTVALVVLLAGAARAGLGGWWLPVAGAVSVVADQLTAEVENPFVLVVSFLPIAVALGYVGQRVLVDAARRTAAAPAATSVLAA